MWRIVSFIAITMSQVYAQVGQTCHSGWIPSTSGGGEDHCYKFVMHPQRTVIKASEACQVSDSNGLIYLPKCFVVDSATLVSINSAQEHNFVKTWLRSSDQSRESWFTGGIVSQQPAGVRWQGDGSETLQGSDLFFHSAVQFNELSSGSSVIYSFENGAYGWSVDRNYEQLSFICEIPLIDVYKIAEEERDFDYGLDIENPEHAPQGPKFVEQPARTTILSQTSATYFDCLATGSPKPTYRWMIGRLIGRIDREVDMSFRSRFIMTGGRLTINDPRQEDDGFYQCIVSNSFGTVLSKPAMLSFGSLGEFSNVAPEDVHGYLSNGAVMVCPQISGSPAMAYFWFKRLTETSTPVYIRPENQVHIFISNSGKLFFSELATSDDGTYFCSVSLTSRHGAQKYIGASQSPMSTSLGVQLHVEKGVSDEYHPDIPDDFVRVYPGNPMRGQTVQLECFAYGTTPLTYTWHRYGSAMPATASMSNIGRVLTIRNVQLRDQGQYRCRVYNERMGETDEKNLTFIIQAEPYFTYPLSDQHVDVGSRLSWHCVALGKPLPTYLWYKNGVLLRSSPGLSITENTLTFASLSKERDNGMYQCAARNLHGLIYSSAQIRVLEIAPTFRKQPVNSFLPATIGGNVTIICNPEAAPTPTYDWLYNGQSLGLTVGGAGSGGRQVLHDGNLLITDVNNAHRGEYTCHVTNNVGEARSSGILHVFPTVRISQPPRNVEQFVNGSATMLCSASAPASVDLAVVWRFNGHAIDMKRFVEFLLGSSGNLYIRGVQFHHEGEYSCDVITAMNSDSRSAYLNVKGPPGEPNGVIQGDSTGADFRPIGRDQRAVRLYWSDGARHGSDIISYTIQFRTNFDKRWRSHPQATQIESRFVTSQEHPDKRTVQLTDLKPYAGHEFRVQAINQYGIGDPSRPTSVIHVKGSPPLVAPSPITGGGGKVGDLSIRWPHLPLEDHNGPSLSYIIFWRAKANNLLEDSRWEQGGVVPDGACKQIPDIITGRINTCQFVTLVGKENYYKPYEARVQATNAFGAGLLSQIYTIMSAEEMPIATPRDVYSVSYNATALEVHWTPVEDTREWMRGRLIGYRINYWHQVKDREDQARFNIVRLGKLDNIDNGLVIGLVPGHWYIVNVQAISSAGYGPKSEDFPQETANFAPGLYPTEVHVYSIKGTGVHVTFRGISTLVQEEPLKGYKIQYWPSGENIRKAYEFDCGRTNYATITNLTENVLFQLRVYGYSNGGQGKRSSPSVYFTVGDGENNFPFNPETTEIMAGASGCHVTLLVLIASLSLTFIVVFSPGVRMCFTFSR